MSFRRFIFYSTLRSTALYSVALALFAPMIAQAFNPNEGAVPLPSRSTRVKLPPTTPLISPMPRLTFSDANVVQRQVPQENEVAQSDANMVENSVSARPKLAFPENTAARQTPSENAIAMPSATATSITPNVIDRATVANRSFVAPAPLIATALAPVSSAQVTALPEALGEPRMVEGLPVSLSALPIESITPQSSAPLSDASKKVLSSIPSKIDTIPSKSGKLAISRMTPDLLALAKNPKVESFDSGGLSIKVQRPGLDANFELNRAYTSLMGGETSAAIETYKNILSSEPDNEDALFGLASTYHRIGNIESARPYYASLLKHNPNHREGLNNFLALISDESPQEALAELERLEQRNPDFSPIPAQQAVLLTKLGYTDRARDKMLRAIELAPNNLTYKYNLAIMMDKSGHYGDASALYRVLIDAALNGQKIPASTAALQKRLNFIATVRPTTPPVGG